MCGCYLIINKRENEEASFHFGNQSNRDHGLLAGRRKRFKKHFFKKKITQKCFFFIILFIAFVSILITNPIN